MTDTAAPTPITGRPGQAYEAAKLRWATLADAPRLVELWGSVYPEDDAGDMAAWLEHGGAMLLQDPTGRLLAALRWREEGLGWRVDRVATQAGERGQGYGRWLATKVEALAIRKNVAFLLLALPDDDPEQLAYYQRLGYQVVGGGDEDLAARVTLRKTVGGVWQTKATPPVAVAPASASSGPGGAS